MPFFHRKRPWDDNPSSEITSHSAYLSRREFMGASAALLGGVAGAAGAVGGSILSPSAAAALTPAGNVRAPGTANPGTAGPRTSRQDPQVGPVTYGEDLRGELNDFEAITTYNNFYEFGYDKSDPHRNSGDFEPLPWTVRIEGEARNTGTFALEDFVNRDWIEERIYRMRCVEAWSMVIPWKGIPLRNVIARAEPTSRAKYVAFETVYRPDQMPGQRRPLLDWPYREGLRIDEAANELTFLATGLYGEDLLPQNGAPLRLVTPWKYGFKGIKSIVAIRFVEEEPYTTWRDMAPHEYGFYGNVNPNVDHPRWSQARERRIGEFGRRPTLMFNGYGEQVAHLYAGMDLARNY